MTTIQPEQEQQAVQQAVQQTASNPSSIVDENVNIATISDGGRELSKTILYVGNINGNVSEEQLTEFFSSITPLKSIKILHDKNKPGFNYSFVEYEAHDDAKRVLETLNGTMLGDSCLKMTWAFQTQQLQKAETFNLFVGDLSLEANDELLTKSFSQFPSLIQANVMWDMKTGRSRGYGFVNFDDKSDAEKALQTMNGFVLGDRPIRLNWASHKQQNGNNNNNYNNNRLNRQYNNNHHHNNNNNGNINNNNHIGNNYQQQLQQVQQQQLQQQIQQMHPNEMLSPMMLNHNINGAVNMPNIQQQSQQGQQLQNQSTQNQIPQLLDGQAYAFVVRQTPNWLSVVYLGNLAHFTTQNDLIPLLQNFGYIVNFKLMADKGCAFVTYDSHHSAAMAIVQLNGLTINGRPMKCGWGKQGKVMNVNMKMNMNIDSNQLRV